MATTLNVIITDAGIAEVINAEHTGTAPVVLTQVGLGLGIYTPTPDQTALHDEIKRLSAISGGVVGDNIMHIQALDGAAGASYAVYEVGVYTASGTLFAVYSQALPIIHKAADSEIMLAIDFVLAGFEPTSVTVGDTNYSLAPATTSNPGVVELATDEEAVAGTDTERALTPKSGAAAYVNMTSSQSINGAKTFNSAVTINNVLSIVGTNTIGPKVSIYGDSTSNILNMEMVQYSTMGAGDVLFRVMALRNSVRENLIAFITNSATLGDITINVSKDVSVPSLKVALSIVNDGEASIGTTSVPFNALSAKAVNTNQVLPIAAAGSTVTKRIGSSENPFNYGYFGTVHADSLEGVIPYPETGTGTVDVPVGSFIVFKGLQGPVGDSPTMSANSAYPCGLDGTVDTTRFLPGGTYVRISHAATTSSPALYIRTA
ncbi:MAG: phage tail protein [Firmicutes bacterium]|nr:phage tail protein [Bacillota bacterium]